MNEKTKNNLKEYSPILLRYGLALVFFYFAYVQFTDPTSWTGLIPEFITNMGITAETVVLINAIAETILGIMLVIGLCVRTVSVLLGIHLLSITYTLGFKPSGVRDFGLAVAMFAIFLNGPDKWCLDNKIWKKK